MWDEGDSGHDFWNKAINCGNNSQPGGGQNTKGSKVTHGVTTSYHGKTYRGGVEGNAVDRMNVQRFPGTFTTELWTNSEYEETCNQNFSAERAEISSYGSYRGLGVREGATVFLGWSEMWTDIDETHTSTVLQFRSNCGSGSPAVEMYMRPGRRLELRTRQDARYVKDFMTLKLNTWYDFVAEIRYAKNNTGYIKIWAHEVGSGGSLDYSQPVAQILNNPTMLSGDDCPHIRWGVYRWQSGDKKPSAIPTQDHRMVKYVGPTRIIVGDYKVNGFNAVKPRDPSGETPPPPEVEIPTETPDVPCTLPSEWGTTDIGNPDQPGEACLVDETYSVTGSGADIWSTYDQFHFLYKQLAGDAEITARMTQVSQTNSLTKAGIMMRNSLDPGSKHVFMALNASGVQSYQFRDSTGGNTVNKSQKFGAYTTPHWIKLIRKGNTITGYSSTDGVNWDLMDQMDMPMNEEIYIGIATNSHDNTQLATASFDNVSIEGNTSYVPTQTGGTGLCFDDASGRLVVEAENYTANVPGIDEAIETQWEAQPMPEASNGDALFANGPGFNSQDRTMGGRVDYKISFPKAGTYYLWARIMGTSLADDSFHAGINGNPETFGGYGLTTLNHHAWIWVGSVLGNRITITIPTAGDYILNAWIREDGTAVDKFIITDNENYLPIGLGPSESTPCPNPTPEECTEAGNLALNKIARQSSQYGNGGALIAVDGDTDGSRGPWNNPSITHTQNNAQAWWEVDLGDIYEIDEITYFGRTDCCQERLRDVYIMVSSTPFTDDLQENLARSNVKYTFVSNDPNPSNTVAMEKYKGRYVRFQLRGSNFLSLAEVQVMGCTTPVSGAGNTPSQKLGDPFSAIQDPIIDNLTLAPNPTSGDTRVMMSNAFTGTFEVLVHDMVGRLVKREVIEKDSPQYNYMLFLDKLTTGFYAVTVTNGTYRKTEKLWVKS